METTLDNSSAASALPVSCTTPDFAKPQPARREIKAAGGQRLLWRMEARGARDGALNVPVSIHLHGALDQGAMSRAVTELVQRHESLRTSFVHYDADLFQRVEAEPTVELQIVDTVPEQLDEAVQAASRRPFDFDVPPVEITLFRSGPEDHTVLLNMHHLVTDAWSNRILVRDLGTFYSRAVGAPAAAELPPMEQYFDALERKRTGPGRDKILRARVFWSEELRGAQLPALAAGWRNANGTDAKGARTPFELDPAVTTRLQAIARERRTTLFSVLLTLMYVVIRDMGGQRDLSIGTMLASRGDPRVHNTVGFFISLVLLRARLPEDEDFFAALDVVHRSVLRAVTNQDMPYHLLPKQDRVPLAGAAHDVVFHMLATPVPGTPAFGELDVRVDYWLATLTQRFGFEVVAVVNDGRVDGLCRYMEGLVPETFVRTFIDKYVSLAETVTQARRSCAGLS